MRVRKLIRFLVSLYENMESMNTHEAAAAKHGSYVYLHEIFKKYLASAIRMYDAVAVSMPLPDIAVTRTLRARLEAIPHPEKPNGADLPRYGDAYLKRYVALRNPNDVMNPGYEAYLSARYVIQLVIDSCLPYVVLNDDADQRLLCFEDDEIVKILMSEHDHDIDYIMTKIYWAMNPPPKGVAIAACISIFPFDYEYKKNMPAKYKDSPNIAKFSEFLNMWDVNPNALHLLYMFKIVNPSVEHVAQVRELYREFMLKCIPLLEILRERNIYTDVPYIEPPENATWYCLLYLIYQMFKKIAHRLYHYPVTDEMMDRLQIVKPFCDVQMHDITIVFKQMVTLCNS